MSAHRCVQPQQQRKRILKGDTIMKPTRLVLTLLVLVSFFGVAVPHAAIASADPKFKFCITEVVSPVSATTAFGETTAVTFEVTNTSKWAVSFIAFGTGGLTRMAPTPGEQYQGQLDQYTVEWTNLSGNPGFESIKFTTSANKESYKNGATEAFTVILGGLRSDYTFSLQAHAGAVFETQAVSFGQEPGCGSAGS